MKNNVKVEFNKVTHTYFIKHTGKVLTSVTQQLNKITPVFDVYGESIKYAKKHGNTPEHWRKEWKRINTESLERGNKIHDKLDESISYNGETKNITSSFSVRNLLNCLNGNLPSKNNFYNTYLATYPEILKDFENDLNDGWEIFSEILVYNIDYLTAGTIDVPLIKKKERKIKIKDWKTNKDDLHSVSGYYKKVNGVKSNIWVNKDERLLYPLNYLQHCKLVLYELQLSLYGFLAETSYNLTVDGIELWHIHPNYVKKYKLNYKKEDVINLLTYLNNKNKNETNKQVFGIF